MLMLVLEKKTKRDLENRDSVSLEVFDRFSRKGSMASDKNK
jgi:hypothetical protein